MALHELTRPEALPRIVSADPNYPKPKLMAPTTLGYLYLAAAVAPPGRVPFVLASDERSELIRQLKMLAPPLGREPGVVDLNIFHAIVVPPTGRFSKFMTANPGRVPIANFDVMALVRVQSIDETRRVRESKAFQVFSTAMRKPAKAFHQMAAHNIRRIADVPLDEGGGLSSSIISPRLIPGSCPRSGIISPAGMWPKPSSAIRWRWPARRREQGLRQDSKPALVVHSSQSCWTSA